MSTDPTARLPLIPHLDLGHLVSWETSPVLTSSDPEWGLTRISCWGVWTISGGRTAHNKMTAGSLPKLHPATLSYRPPLRLTQIGAFWCLADRCQRDFPALSDMVVVDTAMAGSKQSHGSLFAVINDLCPIMELPVVPQHLGWVSSCSSQGLQLKIWSPSISQDLKVICLYCSICSSLLMADTLQLLLWRVFDVASA